MPALVLPPIRLLILCFPEECGVAPLLKVQRSVKRHMRVVSTARRSIWSAPVLLGSSRSYLQDASPILDISGPRNCPTLNQRAGTPTGQS